MTRISIHFTLLVTICCAIRGVDCQSFDEVKHLTDILLNNEKFSKNIRPVINQSAPVTVLVDLYLLAIHGLDEVQESLKTTGILQIMWIDDNLHWNASDNGIEFLTLPQDLIWKPDIALKNSLQSYKPLGDKSLNVHLSSEGGVTWVPYEVFLSTCAIDITHFPNDVQTCEITFVAWSYTVDEVGIIGPMEEDIPLEESNSGWALIDTRWHYGELDNHTAQIVFEIKLKRKSSYSMLTLIFPIIVLSILNLFVFVLPCSSGEKSGYAVTVFLAFAVFLTILESSFPHNSETNSYFAILVLSGTVQSTVITIVTLFMVRFSSYGEDTDVPSWLVACIRFTRCKAVREIFKRKTNKTRKILPVTQSNAERQSAAITRPDEDRNGEEDQTERQVYTWQYCIDCLDVVFFCFFTATCVVSLACYFIMIN